MSLSSIATAILTACIVLPILVGAQANDQFIVNQFIGTDDPPTIPGNVIAVPQSTSAITVTWDASTDDSGLAGYEVFRDAMFLATVTVPTLSYADTGLTPSTTYAYEVRAYDTGYQYSAFSTSSATTTHDVATTSASTTPESSGGGSLGTILSFSAGATPGTDSIALTITSNERVSVSVSWAGTGGAVLGTLTAPTRTTLHETSITGLRSGATYRITVTVTDERGRTATRTLTVTTIRTADAEGPANPSAFTAKALPLGNRLSWQNPSDEDFENVRIMRLPGAIPVDPYDGEIIYEGPLEGYFDSDVDSGALYGYTIFARDTSGTYSSGAVALVRAWSDDDVGEVALELEGPEGDLLDGMTIEQGDTVAMSTQGTFTITNDGAFLVSVPAEKFPKVLKTIVVTLRHPNDQKQTFTFLLRANREKTAYEARIDSLTTLGRYGATIAFLDLSSNVVEKNDFAIEVTEGLAQPHEEMPSEYELAVGRILVLALGVALVAWALRRMWLLGVRVRHTGTADHTEGY